ncbi:peptide-methionine (S)-S-oxide reductase MsrA [Paenibacillus sp. 1P07SE]|uniref:peptide-methionine (S)-S-oxide reductase MsrA n=1 Tax=Paenibacillus sp. 1P07SE TaxID=3132209 RepID=UPI0039A6E637
MESTTSETNAAPHHQPWQTATFGMGCFWSPDAYFGHLPGVVRTRAGYGGGTTPAPTYREMGDHTETVQLEYDPGQISYEDLLTEFWSRHNPDNLHDYKGNQYRSLILYHHEEQREAIEERIRQMAAQGRYVSATAVEPCRAWHLAEERHQKYYLKRYPDAVAKVRELFPNVAELVDGTLTARLNGLAKGYTSLERILRELETWPVSDHERRHWAEKIRSIKW